MKFVPLSDGGRIAYSVKGGGPTLLIMQSLGGSMYSWNRLGSELARGARVIAFDYRGAGHSSAPPLHTTTRGMARDALALLNHLTIKRAHVLGISLGGMAASWLAIDAPERVHRLVLASTLPRGLNVDKSAIGLGISMARCFMDPALDVQACIACRILSPWFRAANPDEIRRIRKRELAQPASRRGLLALMAAAAMHNARARLHDITAETLVLSGELDPLCTAASQAALVRGIPHAAHRVIAGAGHSVAVEAPEETAALVLAHIRTG